MPTKIEWADETWNPLIGCTRCSEGCDNCYAVGTVWRGEAMGTAQHAGLVVRRDDGVLDWTGEVRVVEHLMDQPLRWKRPRKIFVNSLSDLFAAEVADETILRIFKVMRYAPQHTFQILTKRPQRMAAFTRRLAWRTPTADEQSADPKLRGFVPYLWDDGDANQESCGGVPPLPNVWLGTSVEADRWAFRADHLRRTIAAVRFISAEPLLGPLPSLDLTGIDWLIIGGESGPNARPMHPQWARDLIDRAVETGDKFCGDCGARIVRGFDGEYVHVRSVGGHDYDHRPVDDGTGTDRCAVLFKQWGNWAPTGRRGLGAIDPTRNIVVGPPVDEHGSGEELVRHARPKLAGRTIDGRTWDEFPTPARGEASVTSEYQAVPASLSDVERRRMMLGDWTP